VGVDGETEGAAKLHPDRYYLLGDAGSFFFEPAGDNDGFGSPEAAIEWARTQTVWPDLGRDLRDGAAAVVLGAEWNANQAAQEAHARFQRAIQRGHLLCRGNRRSRARHPVTLRCPLALPAL
jgi:hypothetical protein